MRPILLECEWYDAACKLGDAAGKKLDSAASGAFERFIVSMNEATGRLIKIMLSWWMDPALSPQVSGGGASHSIASVQGALSQLVLLAALIGIVIAMVKMAITHHARFGKEAVFMLVTTMVVTAMAAAATQLFIGWSDQYASWMMSWAASQTGKGSPEELLTATVTTNMLSVSLLSTTLTALAALFQAGFMVLRAALIPAILVFLPVSAATTATGAGKESFNKLLSWLVAFVLYKPVAATIYALGMILVTGTKSDGADDDSTWFMTSVSGLVVIALAVLALPALIKLCAPIASAGTSSMFSGGSALVMAAGAAAGAVALGAGAGGMALAGAGTGVGSAGARGTGATGSAGAGATQGASESGAAFAPPAVGSAPRAITSAGGSPSGGPRGTSPLGGSGAGGAAAEGPSAQPSSGGSAHPAPTRRPLPSGGVPSAAADAARSIKRNAEGAVSDDVSS
ncbi:hypothetical protein [Aestuariimicrobium sp. T2.26MG-19.2B]|uniref:hypothetical protein n=1 Tax=Aestuariimicrobium sp. T2.26MG-19.2B TaxID=3040679 RepID=UPI002477AC93|nr:hypothetical protein [Aestuariimicrobium sp. T2.26MG-19.2B]CAI9411620.1 hypothetical protein AESSP_02687 [Aestuariimicrobium sp. T2.26MG-19.2B]